MSQRKIILLTVLLAIPVFLFLLNHYFIHSADLKPTGFTVDENVLYMSYAHQYLDQDQFSFFYSNPFDGDPQSPKIYFQPIILIFAGLLKIGIAPGLCLSLFGLLMAICCIYLGIKIIQHLIPQSKNQAYIAILFTWGGGLTALAGLMASSYLPGHQTQQWIDGIYLADPAKGWWGLNWGRIFFIPLESWYHFLFLLAIYFILKEKWIGATIIALLLSASHPFTGLEYLIILWEWIAIEKSFFHNKKIPWPFIIVSGLILVLHVYYYLNYLPSYPEHNLIFNQYSAAWTYSFLIFIPAYAIVALISFIGLRSKKHFLQLLEFPHQRLFLTWAIIAFLLSKHEWFIKPMQPIHFTRGYVWAGLFLFSLPILIRIITYLQKTFWRKIVLSFFVLLFLSDNILWTFNLIKEKNNSEWEGHISDNTRDVLNFLKINANNQDLVVGNAALVNYLLNVYTPANSWVSHPFNTPKRDERINQMKLFLEDGIKPAEWNNRRIIIIINKKLGYENVNTNLMKNKLFENESYLVFSP